MKTIKDAVLEHVEQYSNGEIMSTWDAIKALELPDNSTSNTAANFYLSALSTIEQLQKEIQKLKDVK